jgi:putative aldouronate transport system substrate-binding protein
MRIQRVNLLNPTPDKKRFSSQPSLLAGTSILLLMLPLALSACGASPTPANNPAPAADTSVKGQTEAPLEVSIMTITPSTPTASDDNVIKRAIEKATNSKMTIRWTSNNVYSDKLNISLASGDIADLTMINNPFTSNFRTMAAQGAFWDITPYIKDYPNFQKGVSPIAWESTKMADGKNYGIPRGRDENDESFFIIRKDWLDNVGLKPPTTTDELYEVMKAFKEKDPDKNGKNDTTALAAYIPSDDTTTGGGIGPVLGMIESSFTGVTGSWKLVDNKLVYTALLPEVRKSLEYNAKAFQEKLMPEDLLSLKITQVRDLFKTNKAGIIVDKSGTASRVYTTDLKKVVPDFKDTEFYPLTSINGYTPKSAGFNGILAIPKSVPEAKMKRILKLINDWMNTDVSAIQRFGFEGVHHQVVNGVKVQIADKLNADNASDFNQIVNPIDPSLDPIPTTPEGKASQELYDKVKQERSKVSIGDISTGLNSPTAQKVLPDLEKKIQDLKAKIIYGREPITAWDDFVAKTKSDPNVIKMSEEMTQAYLKRVGK